MDTALAVKEVNFNGDALKATKQNDKVYVGVSYICNGIGLTKDQKDRQVKNIQSDEVLNRGCVKFDAGVFDLNNETLGLDIEFLPLWLAKIHVTPTMKRDQPELATKLITYQLEAKKVLAKAFLHRTPADYNEILHALTNNQKVLIKNQRALTHKVHKLEEDNKVLLFPMAREVNKLKSADKPDGEPYILYNRLHDTLCDINKFIEKYEDNSVLSCDDRAFKNLINACVLFAAKKRHIYTGVIWKELYSIFDEKRTLTEVAADFTLRAQVLDRALDILE